MTKAVDIKHKKHSVHLQPKDRQLPTQDHAWKCLARVKYIYQGYIIILISYDAMVWRW